MHTQLTQAEKHIPSENDLLGLLRDSADLAAVSLPNSDENSGPVVTDCGGTAAHEKDVSLEYGQENLDIQLVETGTRGHLESQIPIISASHPPPLVTYPAQSASGPPGDYITPAVNVDSPEAPTFIETSVLESFPGNILSTAPDEEKEAEPDDAMSARHAESDHMHDDSPARITEHETREGYGDCGDLPSSLPPSSSPPQLFSSSPNVSSQSSEGGANESSNSVRVNQSLITKLGDQVLVEEDGRSDDVDHAVQASQNGYGLDAGDDKYLAPIEDSPGPSRKRGAYQRDVDVFDGLHPTKRPKRDSHLYPPPAPVRATLVSQNIQYKKLATPFRPPSKLPVARNTPTRAINKEAVESAGSPVPEIVHDKPDVKELTQVPGMQHKVGNTSRSTAQFKSPLVNGVPAADSRTIRLTPALQALERKLQLLKRAIKVKEDNEVDVLARLTTKWIEAGREVAYDVWDAIKDTGDFLGKTSIVHKPYGWESTGEGNTSWGWDAKPGDAGDESCDYGSRAPYEAGRLAPEEGDDDGSNNTLGTMLRQLGIDPEIFGWDDDKEIFSD